MALGETSTGKWELFLRSFHELVAEKPSPRVAQVSGNQGSPRLAHLCSSTGDVSGS